MSFSYNIIKLAARAAAIAITVVFPATSHGQEVRSWMDPEVGEAWSLGFKGQRTAITVIDDFSSSSRFYGILGATAQTLRHGEWTRLEASLIAPSAMTFAHDFGMSRSVTLRNGFNALNLSYGMFAPDGASAIRWSNRESSIITFARDGRAVVVKAAGNDAVAVGAANTSGQVDYLARDLIGRQSAIFVGALSANGTKAAPASLAAYSNFAGANPTVQQQFLVVGVEGSETNLYGTSFAAPVVTGYAAILSSKFSTATPTQIRNQLLNTARTDTVANYNLAIHGRGEASIKNALAPVSIR